MSDEQAAQIKERLKIPSWLPVTMIRVGKLTKQLFLVRIAVTHIVNCNWCILSFINKANTSTWRLRFKQLCCYVQQTQRILNFYKNDKKWEKCRSVSLICVKIKNKGEPRPYLILAYSLSRPFCISVYFPLPERQQCTQMFQWKIQARHRHK